MSTVSGGCWYIGVAHTVTWDAAGDGLAGVRTISLRVTPRDKDGAGTAGTVGPLVIGNTPPVVTSIRKIGDTGNVVIRYTISDTTADLASFAKFNLRSMYSVDGGQSFSRIVPEAIVGGSVETLVTSEAGLVHDFTWNTKETLGDLNGDGRADLAAANSSDNELTILLQE